MFLKIQNFYKKKSKMADLTKIAISGVKQTKIWDHNVERNGPQFGITRVRVKMANFQFE